MGRGTTQPWHLNDVVMVLIIKRYGDDAMLEAAERADQLLDEGDLAGAAT